MLETSHDVTNLVQEELERIRDPLILETLRKLVVEPFIRNMDWDCGPEGQTYPCWVVARSEPDDTDLVYSEYGFGPKCPWGLVGISFNQIGMDSGWFTSLIGAFCESFMAYDLPIWDVVEIDQGKRQVLVSSVLCEEADARVKEIRANLSRTEILRFRVELRDPASDFK